jgi:hypothetical protein
VKLVDFSGIDVYSLVDADSEDARTFTTYLGYCVCLAEHIQQRYGDAAAPALLAELHSRPAFRRLPARASPQIPKPYEPCYSTAGLLS